MNLKEKLIELVNESKKDEKVIKIVTKTEGKGIFKKDSNIIIEDDFIIFPTDSDKVISIIPFNNISHIVIYDENEIEEECEEFIKFMKSLFGE